MPIMYGFLLDPQLIAPVRHTHTGGIHTHGIQFPVLCALCVLFVVCRVLCAVCRVS
jgi:hypothetical protein